MIKYTSISRRNRDNIQLDFATVEEWKNHCWENTNISKSILVEANQYMPVCVYEIGQFYDIKKVDCERAKE